MIVKITYDDQRLDVFDTSAFTAGLPLGKANMLTNFEVRFDTMGEGGLWLAAHSYQACGEHEDEDGEIPVARRTKGWRFLLSSAEELEHVELVVVDGEAIIKRVLGHLIDLAMDILQHLEKQQFFGREVFIEQSLRDARCLGQLLDRGLAQPQRDGAAARLSQQRFADGRVLFCGKGHWHSLLC